MTGWSEDVVEQQAYLARFLLDYSVVPLIGKTFLRGMLPTRDAVRIVTGAGMWTGTESRAAAGGAETSAALVAYEIPLVDEDGEAVTAPLVLGWVRTLSSHGPVRTDASVMGMALVRVDASTVEPAPPEGPDKVLRVLRTLAWPTVDEAPSPALCGFLVTGGSSMRLYLSVEGAGGLIAADVRLTGATTALLAALPTLVREKERWGVTDDPHCVRAVDLTDW
ncbi:hypothetical protein AB0467_25855 [Streptomyces sp. NPDC052095]|uniref:hypothetical protein n=1 Tax=unclassified Streptomyces TaxID=2593676 RepID=UPI00344FC32E